MTAAPALTRTAHESPVPALVQTLPAPFTGYFWGGVQVTFAGAMTVGHWDSYDNPWLVVLAVLLSGLVVSVPLSRRWGRTMLGRAAPFAWVGILALVGSQIHPPIGELSVLWPASAASLAMGLLAAMGRVSLAWIMTLIIMAQSALWGMTQHLSGGAALELSGAIAAPMTGTLYRYLMRKSQRQEAAARQEEAAALEVIARMASQVEARWEYRTRLLAQVGPLLERVASGEELTAAERAECRLTEASLRDAIRGRGLATEEVLAEARAARERGVSVSLIDDRRIDIEDEVCREIIAATRETLAKASGGDTVVARVLPIGRRNLATVLLVNPDGEGTRQDLS